MTHPPPALQAQDGQKAAKNALKLAKNHHFRCFQWILPGFGLCGFRTTILSAPQQAAAILRFRDTLHMCQNPASVAEGERMNTQPTRPAAEEPPDAAAPADLPLFGPLGAALASLKKNIQKRSAEAQQEREDEPEPLPEIDEEELRAIADPEQRKRERQRKIEFYRQFPNGREVAETKSQNLKAEREKIVQLALWPERTRGTPNSFLRGALFAAIQGKERQYLKGALLATQQGIEIRFTGMQLDQSDFEVWEQAVTLAAKNQLGNYCLFKIKGFLRDLDRNDGKSDREWLKDVFRRLMSAGVEIKHGAHTYGGSLLEFWHDDEADTYKLQLNPRILALYQAGWTALDWETRGKLRRKPLACWLHGWLSSNAENYPTKVETIRQLSGSKTKTLFKFRQNLKAALTILQKEGVLVNWAIDPKTDNASFERTPSASQQRHLIRKLAKTPKTN